MITPICSYCGHHRINHFHIDHKCQIEKCDCTGFYYKVIQNNEL